MHRDSGFESSSYFKPGGAWGRYYVPYGLQKGLEVNVAAECSFCNALVAPPRTANPNNVYFNRDDVECWVLVGMGAECAVDPRVRPCQGCTPSQNGFGVCDSFAP